MHLISKLKSRRVGKGTERNNKMIGKLYNYIMHPPVESALVSLCIHNFHIYSFKC